MFRCGRWFPFDNTCRIAWALISVFLLLLPALATAGEGAGPTVRGSVSLAYYYSPETPDFGLEGRDSGQRLLERVGLNARQLAPGLSFATSFTVRHWFGGDRDGESKMRLYQSYLEYQRSGARRNLGIKLGRHWVYSGGAVGLTDGVSLSLRCRQLRLVSFWGTLDPEDRDLLRWPDPDRSQWWGAHGTIEPFRWIELSGGYSEERRNDADDRELLTAGITLRCRRGVQVLYEHRYDFVQDTPLSRSLLASWRPDGRREFWFEASRRRPDLPASSFFADFMNLGEEERNELRGGFRFPLKDNLELSSHVSAIDHGSASPAAPSGPSTVTGWEAREEERWSVIGSATFTLYGQSIGYVNAWGYGGARQGFLWSLSHRVSPKVLLGFDGDLTDYVYGAGYRVAGDLTTLRLRAEADLGGETSLVTHVEFLSSRLRTEDTRLLVRLRRGFRLGGRV